MKELVREFQRREYGFELYKEWGEYAPQLSHVQEFISARGVHKLVLISSHKAPAVEMDGLTRYLSNVLDTNNFPISSLEVFSTEVILSAVQQGIKNKYIQRCQLHVEIFDQIRLKKIDNFVTLFTPLEEPEENPVETTIFDILAEGSNSSEIKDSLVKAVIVSIVYKAEKMTLTDLKINTENKLGISLQDFDHRISKLLMGRILVKDQESPDYVRVSERECASLRSSIDKSEREEADFRKKFEQLCANYEVTEESSKVLFAALLRLYKTSSEIDLKTNSLEAKYDSRRSSAFSVFSDMVCELLGKENQHDFMLELRTLCQYNSFMTRISSASTFVNLYKSPNFEKYLNSKLKYIYLDTRPLLYYICYRSGYYQKGKDWDDRYYKSVTLLEKLHYQKGEKPRLFVYSRYIKETAGELKKALRTARFEKFKNLAIPLQSSNVFYNYYIFLRDNNILQREDGSISFEWFVKSLGFTNIDPESEQFTSETMNYLKRFMKVLGIQYVETETYELYDEARMEYAQIIKQHGKYKSDPAQIADVSQVLHLATRDEIVNGKYVDYYVATWDHTFADLRDWLSNSDINKFHMFSILSPGLICNKLSLASFNIEMSCLTDEIFAYAETKDFLSEKIKNLFDTVLIPIFGKGENVSARTLGVLVQLQKDYLSQKAPDEIELLESERLPLERVFSDIYDLLEAWGCSKDELGEYMRAEVCSEEINSVFSKIIADLSKKMDYTAHLEEFHNNLLNYVQVLADQNKELL